MALSTSAIGFEGYEKKLEISFFEPESSLFVYPYKIIIKTCGTTKLLLSIPVILRLAGNLSLFVRSVRYTRGSVIFPGAQPFPHSSFSEEVVILDGFFGKLGSGSTACVMGGPDNSKKWHIYSASAENRSKSDPIYTLEMCMTGLDKKRASVFYKTHASSANVMTEDSGIRKILLQSEICAFEFDPCAEFSIALCADNVWDELEYSIPLDLNGYFCKEKGFAMLGNDGFVTFHPFVRAAEISVSPKSILKCCWSDDEKEEKILQHGHVPCLLSALWV
ncbi:hypothetical protein SLA2020_346930 [Shorea laevis]